MNPFAAFADPKIMRTFGPLYWRHETSSSKLAKAINTYLSGSNITHQQAAHFRAYLRQWIFAPIWDLNPACFKKNSKSRAELNYLRQYVHATWSLSQLKSWLQRATAIGLDPL